MGDRGFNAGGWAYMLRVWCSRCGFSYLIGKRDPLVMERDTSRPTRPCSNQMKCAERQKSKEMAVNRAKKSNPSRKQKSVRIELHEEAAVLLRKLLIGTRDPCENDKVIDLCNAIISQIEDELQ